MANLPGNIFRNFRFPGPTYTPETIAGGKISKTFDEPTYLTFRVGFRSINTGLESTNYDKMPNPLFDTSKEDDISARNWYSTIQFLRDANEFVRARMLESFIEQWNDIQNNYQWYFQSISGIDNILKIDPKRGIRVSKDGKITLTMLEGLDLRITHLLNLYRKIAWDDVYQRWILPDMMRFFQLDIYITEFRIFHQSNFSATPVGTLLPGSETPKLILKTIDALMPTYVMHCERCEFDITSFNSHLNTFKVSDAEMAEITFDIKVGNITEEYRNPILDYYWSDRIINGRERTLEFILQDGEVTGEGPGGTIVQDGDVEWNPLKLSKGLSSSFTFIHPDEDYGDKAIHESGRPFIETGGSGQSNIKNSNYSTNVDNVNPTLPSTWTGNAITFGKAFGENAIDSLVGKASMTVIPKLGFSFNEALATIQSKNVFNVLGLVRRSISDVVDAVYPSQELDNKVIDQTFKQFLQNIAISEATDQDAIELQTAANQVLNDRGIWEVLKDFSRSTDLVSKSLGERNTPNTIENPTTYKNYTINNTGRDRSLATDLDGVPIIQPIGIIFEGPPSSATTRAIIKTE